MVIDEAHQHFIFCVFIVLGTENLYQLMWENKHLGLSVAIKTDIQTTIYVTVTSEM